MVEPTSMGGGVQIANTRVGAGMRCFIIAEAGVNHDGDVVKAKELVDAAADAHADAVKFQTFKADRVTVRCAPKALYQRSTTNPDESQHSMLRRLELSHQDHLDIMEHCGRRGIQFLSTPFDEDSADLLEGFGMAAFKIASGELTNHPLISHIARKQRPVMLSTGMASAAEVESAVKIITAVGNTQLVLLHCVSEYPADPADANLRAIRTLRDRFRVPVGYSDHTPGCEVAAAAVALGACVLEKHLTLGQHLPGPDHAASLEPQEFAELVRQLRTVESALGDGVKRPAAAERATAAVARRSIVAAVDIPSGTELVEEDVAFKRPGVGLPPPSLHRILGRLAKYDIPAETLLRDEMFETRDLTRAESSPRRVRIEASDE